MTKVYKTSEGWRCKKKNDHLLRAQWKDYRNPAIMLLTLVTIDRKPLLGELRGQEIQRTTLGQQVAEEIERIPTYHYGAPIEIYSYVIMPDHVHILLQIHERLPMHIGKYVQWFKKQCSEIGYALAAIPASKGSRVFAPEYHDRILMGKNQLAAMKKYVHDNPRRLALKRANKELFKIYQDINIAGIECTLLGNLFLADYPMRQVIQCSRRLTQEEIDHQKNECLAAAEQGVVHITAAISEGEKRIARALRERGYPLIILLHDGFPKPDSPHYRYFKPQGVYFEACAAGKLLLVEPKDEALERANIAERVKSKIGNIPHNTQRYRFVAMNMIAEEIAKGV